MDRYRTATCVRGRRVMPVGCSAVVRLYWMAISHPSQAVRKMLDVKRVDYELVNVLPLTQRVHLRIAGFRRGTVPALKLDGGQRVQGSLQIARALDRRWPDPPLYGADPALRARIEEAEWWGETRLQPIPRRLARFAAAENIEVRRSALAATPLPGSELLARLSGPPVRYYARADEPDGRRADSTGVRADLIELPALLDRVDQLLADGTLALDPPNAASCQLLSTVRALGAFADLREIVGPRPCAAAARELFPRYSGALPPCLPREWVQAANLGAYGKDAMARSGDIFTLHDGERVTVRTAAADSGGALLEVEAEWAPAGHKPLLHFHPHQDEHFEILEGELSVKLDRTVRVLHPGDTLDVPRGAVHGMWNSGATVTRASWQVRPALRTEQFFEAVHRMRAVGHAGKGGMITPAAAGMIFQAFPDEFRLALPGVVRRPLTVALATVGRVRGYPRVTQAAAS